MSDELSLDCTPVSPPVNAFTRMAKELKDAPYDTEVRAKKGAEWRLWLLHLSKLPIPADSVEPVLLVALARLAIDGRERLRFAAVIEAIDKAVADVQSGASVPVETQKTNGAGRGFVIGDDGEVHNAGGS